MSEHSGWKYVHEWQSELVAQDGFMCEQHPGKEFPHDDCAGPGIPWVIVGRANILALTEGQPPASEKETV